MADVVIVLVQPETGDELQWEKAGQLEIADIVVVHKADLPTADRTLWQLRELLNLPGCRPVPVVRVSSSKGPRSGRTLGGGRGVPRPAALRWRCDQMRSTKFDGSHRLCQPPR